LSNVKAQDDKRKDRKASSCNNIFPSKVLSTENFNQPKLWHMVCTILEGPLASFLSTSNQNHLPRCALVRHKCKESNGLILPWLKFASRNLLQIFIKVGSLVALLPPISSHMFIWLCGSMQQQEKCSSSNHHVRMLLTYHHVFYVKPGMSQAPKLWLHVLEHISNVMNI